MTTSCPQCRNPTPQPLSPIVSESWFDYYHCRRCNHTWVLHKPELRHFAEDRRDSGSEVSPEAG
jgi:hypothetical protein